jgi:hypothetical protein
MICTLSSFAVKNVQMRSGHAEAPATCGNTYTREALVSECRYQDGAGRVVHTKG